MEMQDRLYHMHTCLYDAHALNVYNTCTHLHKYKCRCNHVLRFSALGGEIPHCIATVQVSQLHLNVAKNPAGPLELDDVVKIQCPWPVD